METYSRNKAFWDNVFEQGTAKKIGISELEKNPQDIVDGLRWVCKDAESIIDFGCGNGTMLMQCACLGTKKHIGIDISQNGINLAKEFAAHSPAVEFDFECGDIKQLEQIPGGSMDAAIASNIIDNLTPEDAKSAIEQLHRILKSGGKLFFKVNPFLSPQQIQEYEIKPIRGNFLDDGLYLWNLTTEEWKELLLPYFELLRQVDVYFPKHEQYNRLFLLVNK